MLPEDKIGQVHLRNASIMNIFKCSRVNRPFRLLCLPAGSLQVLKSGEVVCLPQVLQRGATPTPAEKVS